MSGCFLITLSAPVPGTAELDQVWPVQHGGVAGGGGGGGGGGERYGSCVCV